MLNNFSKPRRTIFVNRSQHKHSLLSGSKPLILNLLGAGGTDHLTSSKLVVIREAKCGVFFSVNQVETDCILLKFLYVGGPTGMESLSAAIL